MTAKKHNYRLLLFSDSTSQKREINLPQWKVILLTAVAVVFLGSITYGSSRVMAEWMTKWAMSATISENQELHQHLAHLTQKLDEVHSQLNQLAGNDDQLRLLADLPKIDEDTREVGIGGDVVPNSETVTDDQTVRRLIFDLDKIEREIRLQQSSFEEIEQQLLRRKDLSTHIPSIRPIEGGFMSSGFGYRTHPLTGRWTHHNGIDLVNETGTPVNATSDGRVIFAKRTPGFGKFVIIDHGYGFKTAYGHLSRISVSKGQSVARGDKIGELGESGRTTGPHLHYEVRVNDRPINPIDYIFQNYAELPHG